MVTNLDISYGVGEWDAATLGNHRAIVRVDGAADAVWVSIPWRRRDPQPEQIDVAVVNAASGARVANTARARVTRECGDLVFQAEAAGDYFVYFMPFTNTGRVNYPTITYTAPQPTADPGWLARQHLTPDELPLERWRALPRAQVTALQSAGEFERCTDMERIATRAEVEALLAQHPAAPFLVFPEDRAHSIRMSDDLPKRWIDAGPNRPFHGAAARGEYYVFQLGIYAARGPAADLSVEFDDVRSAGGDVIPASALNCFNLGGVNWDGRDFRKSVTVESGRVQALWCGVQVPADAAPGEYSGRVVVSVRGAEPVAVAFRLTVMQESIAVCGDDEMERLSRLRWLDSRIALDDEVVAPFTPVDVAGNVVGILGRQVAVGRSGFPASIRSFFAPEVTHLVPDGRELLRGPVTLSAITASGDVMKWSSGSVQVEKAGPGRATWHVTNTAGPLRMDVRAGLEFDGCIEYAVALSADQAVALGDVRLDIPLRKDVAQYAMGLGLKGGRCPADYAWQWDAHNNQDSAWVGDVNAGLQFTLKDERYSRPLNTNFYQLKPLVMPASWHNEGRGAVRLTAADDDTFRMRCSSGPREMAAGQVLHFNFRLLLTPFKPLNTDAQWNTRFYHRYAPLDTVAGAGGNTINVHHATDVNPYINYPFFRNRELKEYVDAAHARAMRVKLYYTVRELTNRAPELFALRSLGDEVFSDGPGGGWAWLQEHMGGHYIAGWFVPPLQDAALINSGMSRWLNFYLEGLDWLARNEGIDGLYIDDVAYDRTIMKRVRKILDRRRPAALIDLHSANQYNPRDGFANSANLYLEHFPFLDRLWFGEYFDYNSAPDFWLVELAGIPFGLMSEMLQDGGNAWRGMLYGMTSRAPWAGNPQAIWQAWDEFGMQGSRMIGYWLPNCPVRANRADVLATVYARPGRALIAVASWAPERVAIKLDVDWAALGLDPHLARLTAPAVKDFQDAALFAPGDEIPIEPGRGWMLVASEV
jgi:hypothetical protein